MDRVLLPLTEIQPRIEGWTALVQVLEKQRSTMSRSRNPKRYQKLTFVDEQGNKVQAIIYITDIQFFCNYFELYKRYYVSNARVQFALPQCRAYEGECTWTIDNSTIVEAVKEAKPPILPPVFLFTPVNKLYDHIDDDSQLDDQVENMKKLNQVKSQEFHLENNQGENHNDFGLNYFS